MHNRIHVFYLMMLSIASSLILFVAPFDLCQRVLEDEELDLTAIAVTPRRAYMVTSNFYVYDFPTSVYDGSTFNLLSAVKEKPVQMSRKWPTLAGHSLFQSLQLSWSTVFFMWNDDQDYFCMLNRTRAVAYGIRDGFVYDFSDYGIDGHVTSVWSHLYLSGPFNNLSAVDNDPHYKSTLIVWSHFVRNTDGGPPFVLFDQAFPNPLCYVSDAHSDLFMYFGDRDTHDVCSGLPAKWLVTTGFVDTDRQIHMFGNKERKVFIFSFDIMVKNFNSKHIVSLEMRPYKEFFRCPPEPKPSSAATTTTAAADNDSTTPSIREEPHRLLLVIIIVVASLFCLAIWFWLCYLSLPDCHWQTSPNRSLRRPTVVKFLDSDAKS